MAPVRFARTSRSPDGFPRRICHWALPTKYRDLRALHSRPSIHLLSRPISVLPEDFPVAFSEFQRILSLPCSPRMSDDDVEDVIDAVKTVLKEKAFSRGVSAAFPQWARKFK